MTRSAGGDRADQGPRATGPGPAAKKTPKPPPRSWIWVERDEPERRVVPHEVALGIEPAEGGALIDLYVERGGNEFSGLTLQALRVPKIRGARDLAGQEILEPPPPLLGIGAAPLGCKGGAPSPLRKLAPAPGPEEAVPAPSPTPDIDMEAEEAAPDDDPALGDIESYRLRRAEEAKLAVPEEDPELDEAALAEADAAASAERVLIAQGQAYEVEAVRLRFGALEGGEIAIDVEGRCARIGENGEAEAEVPFGGRLVARVEEA